MSGAPKPITPILLYFNTPFGNSPELWHEWQHPSRCETDGGELEKALREVSGEESSGLAVQAV
jgi:hypothetical protein